MPNPTDPAAALRDALAAVAGMLAVPDDDATSEQRQAWRESCPDRAIRAAVAIEWILRPGTDVAVITRNLREQTTHLDNSTEVTR
jgi:hypothetical protein